MFIKHITIALAIGLLAWALYATIPPPVREILPDVPDYLAYDANAGVWVSPAGLRYGKDPNPRFKTRVDHLLSHTTPDDSKPYHSVFTGRDPIFLLKLIDEAWQARGPPERQEGVRPRDVYDIPMRRETGTKGQRGIRIVTESDTADFVIAYPVK